MEKKNIVVRHRVGTVTLGCILVLYGLLFLLHIVVPALPYSFIFRLWPVVFILLGVEILLSLRKSGEEQPAFIYDLPGIAIMVIMIFFAMVMAAAEQSMWWIR